MTVASSEHNGEPVSKKSRQEDNVESLCLKRDWDEVVARVLVHPEEAKAESYHRATPLALACRFGAPARAVEAILRAAPENIRILLPSRGTPLHEAIVCETLGQEVIELLLRADEKLEGTPRATLMQDVDGHTPLHLLIRRRSTSLVLMESSGNWMPVFEMLIKSCPEAVGIPDRGEYEEPPLVMALKANQYAATSADYDSDDNLYPRIEMRIYEMIETMLRYYPDAAGRVLEGARGQYTALHSAVFHGRCSDTIKLLLRAEAQTCGEAKALLLANTQGELPLHFAAMRGEPPRSISLLGRSAPMAVITRDASGLTPLHWLWIRFVSTILSLDDGQRTTSVELEPMALSPEEQCDYSKFWHVERGNFAQDLILIRRIDPPLDFLRMRHIPPELYDDTTGEYLRWAERCVEVLDDMRSRELEREPDPNDDGLEEWSREEVVSCLFWVKVVQLLRAFSKTLASDDHDFHLVHTAMAAPSCPPPVAHMTSLMFPGELVVRDSKGRFPLHHAAKREWHCFDWKNEENDTAAHKLLSGESLEVLKNAIRVTPSQVTRVVDDEGRLVLHYVIDTFVTAACSKNRLMSAHETVVESMLHVVKDLLFEHPASLERRDGITKLYPFQQAACAASNNESQQDLNEMHLSIVYMLLQENPLLISSALV